MVEMAEEATTVYLLLIVAIVAVVGLGIAVASFVTNQSVGVMMNRGGGGMMGNYTGTSSGVPGPLEWVVFVASLAFFMLAVVLLVRSRGGRMTSAPSAAGPSSMPMEPRVENLSPPVRETPAAAPTSMPAKEPAVATPEPPIAEPTLVKLLDADERRMYLEIRDHGGMMLQRDLVASGIFSKAKVTRVLDKLEAKGIVIREAHGMTNRVRLTAGASR